MTIEEKIREIMLSEELSGARIAASLFWETGRRDRR